MDYESSPRDAETVDLELKLKLAVQELIAGNSDDHPLSEEAVAEMLAGTDVFRGSDR